MPGELDFSLNETASPTDLISGNGRVERLSWVAKQLGTDGFFFFQDGRFSRYLFQEAIQCFVNGQFIAAIVLGFSFIERSLAGRFFEVGRTDLGRAKIDNLLKEALERGWVFETEYKLLNEMRELRNSVAHFRDPADFSRPEIRAILAAKQPHSMLEDDSRQILDAAIRMLIKTSI